MPGQQDQPVQQSGLAPSQTDGWCTGESDAVLPKDDGHANAKGFIDGRRELTDGMDLFPFLHAS